MGYIFVLDVMESKFDQQGRGPNSKIQDLTLLNLINFAQWLPIHKTESAREKSARL